MVQKTIDDLSRIAQDLKHLHAGGEDDEDKLHMQATELLLQGVEAAADVLDGLMSNTAALLRQLANLHRAYWPEYWAELGQENSDE